MNKNLAFASLALLGMVAGFEGIKHVPYLDVNGVKTVCAGHTGNVEDRAYSPHECAAMLKKDVVKHGTEMLSCVHVDLSQSEYDAYASFSYNVGVGAFCQSTLVKKLNAGDRVGACDQLLRWNKAGGVEYKGLTYRRQAERNLCLEGAKGTPRKAPS